MKTTKKHFQLFCDEAEKWRDIFGLKEYEWVFSTGADIETRAQAQVDEQGKIATLYFADSWYGNATKISDDEIKRVAFHEVCETLLWRIGEMASFGFSDKLVENETHRIIRTLENVLFPKY